MKKHILIPLISILCTVVGAATIRQSLSLNSFNSGELSPLMLSRGKFPKYPSGAQTLENMLVLSQGPIRRRPGTKYIAETKNSGIVRLIPFEYSKSDAYIIEAGERYMRFYRNGGQILLNSIPYEIVTPYDDSDLFELQFVQDAQYMRIVHPDYKPRKLTRTGHTSWTLTAIDFENGPFLDENDDEDWTLTPSATTGSITIVSTDALFDADHVGADFQISHVVEANSMRGEFSLTQFYDFDDPGAGWVTTANSTEITIEDTRYYDVSTHGSWIGTMTLQRSYDDGTTWEDVFASHYRADGNILYSGQETTADAIYRLRYTDAEAGGTVLKVNIIARAFTKRGVVSITTVTDSLNAAGTVDADYPLGGTTATWQWAEGAWSDHRSWPMTIEHHEQRCVYGGSTTYPQAIWASIIADEDSDYDEFTEGDTDDDSWFYNLPGMNPIQWMKSKEYLMIGTTSGVGRLGQPDKPITPTWPPIYRSQAEHGSAYIQSILASNKILYVERGKEKIRELDYSYSSNGFICNDLTVLAEHITGDGIIEMDFQERPQPILWCVREDGDLISMTYLREHEIVAWARHPFHEGGIY